MADEDRRAEQAMEEAVEAKDVLLVAMTKMEETLEMAHQMLLEAKQARLDELARQDRLRQEQTDG